MGKIISEVIYKTRDGTVHKIPEFQKTRTVVALDILKELSALAKQLSYIQINEVIEYIKTKYNL